jgi:hypothetical protein
MSKKATILILVLFVGTGSVAGVFGAGKTGQDLISDGFVLRGVDGRLNSLDGNDVWFFVFGADVNDGKVSIRVDTSLQLLPCSTLEKMTADMKKRCGENYRIWARVTKYKGRNFLFPVYFLPLSKAKKSESFTPTDANSTDTSKTAQAKPRSVPDDPNDKLAIPKEIIDRLSDRPTVYRQQPQEPNSQGQKLQSTKQDYILADRMGFISAGPPSAITPTYGGFALPSIEFVLDGLGLSVQQTSFRLLPCQLLEQAEQQSVAAGLRPEQIRLKIAGIVTEYKGDEYLLLQKVTKVYSHGNFDR